MNKEHLKIVVRHLPPTMSETTFLQAIAPVPPHDYFYYVPGSPNRLHSFSRAYIRFVDSSELRNFASKFDNYVFLDVKGHEYTAQVEFAPFRGMTPTSRTGGRRRDPLQGTIDQQPEYSDFLQRLKECTLTKNKVSPVVQPCVEEKGRDMSTPLVEFIKMKKRSDKIEDRKYNKSKFHKRVKKEAHDENAKEAEESKSASSFFSGNQSRKFKNKKRCQQEVRSKNDSTDCAVQASHSADVGEITSAAVTRAKIQTDCIRKALGFPPIGASSSKEPSSRQQGPDQIQSIESRRSDVKVIDKALSTHNLLPSAFKKK